MVILPISHDFLVYLIATALYAFLTFGWISLKVDFFLHLNQNLFYRSQWIVFCGTLFDIFLMLFVNSLCDEDCRVIDFH